MAIQVWDLPNIRKAMDELQFIVSSNGEIAVGWSNKGEDGGFVVLKRLSDGLAKQALTALRDQEGTPHD